MTNTHNYWKKWKTFFTKITVLVGIITHDNVWQLGLAVVLNQSFKSPFILEFS